MASAPSASPLSVQPSSTTAISSHPTPPTKATQLSASNKPFFPAAQDPAKGNEPSTSAKPVPINASADPASRPTRKRKRTKDKSREAHVIYQATFKSGLWAYVHLRLVTPSTAVKTQNSSSKPTPNPVLAMAKTVESEIDPITVHQLLQPALSSFLGLHGSSIPIDILTTEGREVWLRVPKEDVRTIVVAISQWIGWADGSMLGVNSSRTRVAWRVLGKEESLGKVVGGRGMELFEG